MSEHENNDRSDDGWIPPEPIRVTRPGEAPPPPSGSASGSVTESEERGRQPRRFRGDLIVGGLLIALIAAGGLGALLLGRSSDNTVVQGGGPFFPPVPVPAPLAVEEAIAVEEAFAVPALPIPPGAVPPPVIVPNIGQSGVPFGNPSARPDGVSDIAEDRVGAALVAARADSSLLPDEGIVFDVDPASDGTWWLTGAEPGFSFQQYQGFGNPPGVVRRIGPDGSVELADTGGRSVASVSVIANQPDGTDLIAVVGDGANGQEPAIGLSTDQGRTWEWSSTDEFVSSMKSDPDRFAIPIASVVGGDDGRPLVFVSNPSNVQPDEAIATAQASGFDLNYESFAHADGEGFSYFDLGSDFAVCNGLQQEWYSMGGAFFDSDVPSFRSTVERNEASLAELRAAAPDFTAGLNEAGCADFVACDISLRESNLEFDRAQLDILEEYGLADLVADQEPDLDDAQRVEFQAAIAALAAERNEQAFDLADADGDSCADAFAFGPQPTFVSWESLGVEVPEAWMASTSAWRIEDAAMTPVDVPFSEQYIWSVATDDAGSIRVVGPGLTNLDSAAWELTDGEWQQGDASQEQFGNDSGWVEVAEVGDTAFQVTFDFGSGGSTSGLAQSDDGGLTWTPIDLDEIRDGLSDLQPEGLFAGDALIATVLVERSNFRPPDAAVVLWTTDGLSWEATDIDSGWASIYIGPQGALVVGQPSSPNAPGDLVVISPAS